MMHLHAMQIIHSDIKPANVFVSADINTVKLCDTGLSRTKNTLTATKNAFDRPRHTHVFVCSMCATGCEIMHVGDFGDNGKGNPETQIVKKMKKKQKADGLT